MKCFYCEEDIADNEKKFMIGLDKPYVNLLVHRPECFALISERGLLNYLEANIDKIHRYMEDTTENTRKKGKR